MIDLQNLSVSFSGTYLFSNISFKLNPGNRVGLVGKNGAGKSTLLCVIAGDQEYEGQLNIDKNAKIGYLKQDIDFNQGKTILEETYLAFEEIIAIEKQIDKINITLAEQTDYESEAYHELLHSLDDLTHQYELLGGYTYKGETEKILQGLGFKRENFNQLTEHFSGGWRMRIELAKILLQQNDILLLDEPTNHLDIDSIIWFENFLSQFKGIVLLVSHDSMFLDRVTNRTIEISLGNIYDFKKSYSDYQSIRKELIEKQVQAKKNQDKKIKQTEELIEKFRYKASKAAFAQSLIKKLEKMERIEVDTEDHAVMNVRFPHAEPPGKIIFELENITKSYGENLVIDSYSLLLERGSRIAFVGQNGMGKTTLTKILVQEIDFEGELIPGHNVKIGYFAQDQADYLSAENTLIQEMETVANDQNRVEIRNRLGSFLFGGEEVEKKVKMLSGGERNRLALCKMLMNPFNVLIMDEPTNHLDMASKKVLKKALTEFEGSIILVSHDREFLQGLVDKVYEFRDHKIKEFLGGIDYYLAERNFNSFREVEKKQAASSEKSKEKVNLSREAQKEVKRIKNKISKLDVEIKNIEKEIEAMENKISTSETADLDADFFVLYQEKKDHLDALMEEWMHWDETLLKKIKLS